MYMCFTIARAQASWKLVPDRVRDDARSSTTRGDTGGVGTASGFGILYRARNCDENDVSKL